MIEIATHKKIMELKEKGKIENYELMDDIDEFCLLYPSEAVEERAFEEDYDNFNNIFYEINKFNYLNKKREFYLNDDEKAVVEEFIDYFTCDNSLLHIKDWNIYKNITDREHNGNDYFGEEEVEQEERKKEQWIMEEITGALRGLTELKAKFEV